MAKGESGNPIDQQQTGKTEPSVILKDKKINGVALQLADKGIVLDPEKFPPAPGAYQDVSITHGSTEAQPLTEKNPETSQGESQLPQLETKTKISKKTKKQGYDAEQMKAEEEEFDEGKGSSSKKARHKARKQKQEEIETAFKNLENPTSTEPTIPKVPDQSTQTNPENTIQDSSAESKQSPIQTKENEPQKGNLSDNQKEK